MLVQLRGDWYDDAETCGALAPAARFRGNQRIASRYHAQRAAWLRTRGQAVHADLRVASRYATLARQPTLGELAEARRRLCKVDAPMRIRRLALCLSPECDRLLVFKPKQAPFEHGIERGKPARRIESRSAKPLTLQVTAHDELTEAFIRDPLRLPTFPPTARPPTEASRRCPYCLGWSRCT